VTAPVFQTCRDVMRELLALEERLGLFDLRAAGAYFWEYARLPIYYELTRMLELYEIPSFRTPRRLRDVATAGLTSADALTRKNPLLAREKRDVIFFGYPRRVRQPDGRYSDIHIDPVLPHLAGRAMYLEPLDRMRHYRPSATAEAWHQDVFDWASAAHRVAFPLRISACDHARLRAIEAAFTETFGVRVPVTRLITKVLRRRHSVIPLFERLLRRTSPKMIVVTSPNWREFAAAEVAKSMGIRVAELQHGVIGQYDPSYTFPTRGGEIRYFADDLLLYGDAWKRFVSKSLPTRTVSVGFAHFERQAAGNRRAAGGTARIVFLSQPFIGQKLARWAAEYAAQAEPGLEIVFRLHPSQRNERGQYAFLDGSRVTIDDGSQTPLYDLLGGATAQVGVSSFALYEGLALGLATFVADLPGFEYMAPATEAGVAQLVHRSQEIPHRFNAGNGVPAELFFRSGAIGNLLAYFDEQLGSGGKRRAA
jgi:hypothetical protein